MTKTVIVDCKGEKNVAQLLRDTMQSYIKRNYPNGSRADKKDSKVVFLVKHTDIMVNKDNTVSFPEDIAYLQAFEESKKRISVKFTLKAA
ncbi:MAG TPA: hypothetical protein VK158_04880 [Acidobacteriota bacterium]|nr:hypothetical protein [Acidobacteriota bacterium]